MNNFEADLHEAHRQISPVVTQCLEEYFAVNHKFNLNKEFIVYASKLACSGKMMRAALLLAVTNLSGNKQYCSQARLTAAAIEMFGTGILIHDDIIDQSSTRRSLPSAHYYFASLAKKRGYQDPDQFGISAAICLADLLFFIAEKILAKLKLPSNIGRTLILDSNRELSQLVLAEMEDVRLAAHQKPVSMSEIIEMYLGKTGRYTGRWPLTMGGVLAGLKEQQLNELADIGDQLGLVYQLSDDKLGIYGEEAATGKSSSSDVLSGKKTLYYFYLTKFEGKQKLQLLQIHGNPRASAKQIRWFKHQLLELGISDRVNQQINSEADKLVQLIKQASIASELKNWLINATAFIIKRQR